MTQPLPPVSSSPPTSQRRFPLTAREAFILPSLLLYLVVLFRTAWLADDAFISFRAADNLLAGLGPVWNPGERVQAYSHPLWFFLVTAVRAVTGEFYYSTIFLSFAISLAAVMLASFGGRAPWPRRAFVLALACFSRAFADFSTSGLENPLSHLLFALFFFAWLRPGRDGNGAPRPLGLLSLLATLAALNRQDTALIFIPPLLWELFVRWRTPHATGDDGAAPPAIRRLTGLVGALALGLLPLLAWEIFSVIYYGFPFPNTAYAKLNTGIARPVLLEQGFYYFWNTVEHDPLTLVVIGLGMLAGLLEHAGRPRALALGLGLYLFYVLWIGGDFMAGRFLALPFFGAVMLLSDVGLDTTPRPARWMAALLLAALVVFSVLRLEPALPPFSGPTYPDRPFEQVPYDWRGVADERGGYYPYTGLMRQEPDRRSPSLHFWGRMGAAFRRDRTPVIVFSALGFAGWHMGDRGYMVDLNALADPLLARLPAIQDPPWRIGHFMRVVPEGYIDSLMFGDNRIRDPEVAAYYDDLRIVTRGPLFTRERMKAILRVNRQKTPALADPNAWLYPPQGYQPPTRRHYFARDFESPAEPRTFDWSEGFVLYWDGMRHARGVALSPRPNRDYDVIFTLRGVEKGRVLVRLKDQPAAAESPDGPGLVIAVPGPVSEAGFDAVHFLPREFRGPQTFNWIRLVGEPA